MRVKCKWVLPKQFLHLPVMATLENEVLFAATRAPIFWYFWSSQSIALNTTIPEHDHRLKAWHIVKDGLYPRMCLVERVLRQTYLPRMKTCHRISISIDFRPC